MPQLSRNARVYRSSPGARLVVALSALAGASGLSCSDSENGTVGITAQPIMNGTILAVNDIGLLDLEIFDGNGNRVTTCSGGVFQSGGQQAVLTAAHCIEPGGSVLMRFLDGSVTTLEQHNSRRFIVHPTFVGPRPSRQACSNRT
jgi:hypothetical protein